MNILIGIALLSSPPLGAQQWFPQQWLPIYDTVYILGNVFIEVSLLEQKLWVHRRSAPPLEIPISSGTTEIEDGLETPTGIYTIQTRAKLAISRQFDSARMYWWLGFSGNFGIHALDGYQYYRYLGKKPSSHGCIRVSRESGKMLFALIPKGTPIIIYNVPPARVFAFADSTFDTTAAIRLTERTPQIESHLAERLCYLYEGEFLRQDFPPLYLDGKTVLRHAGFAVGEAYRIPIEQKPPYQLRPFRPLALHFPWTRGRISAIRPSFSSPIDTTQKSQ